MSHCLPPNSNKAYTTIIIIEQYYIIKYLDMMRIILTNITMQNIVPINYR